MPTLIDKSYEHQYGFLIQFENEWYDISDFVDQHPGGEDILQDYRGKDVTVAMKDHLIHFHSEAAFDILKGFKVSSSKNGTAVAAATIRQTNANSVDGARASSHDPLSNDTHHILSFDKPLLMQLWDPETIKSRDQYLKLIHTPRHLSYSARLFENSYLELLTKTPWWVIPLFWFPIAGFLFYSGFIGFSSLFDHQASSLTESVFSQFNPLLLTTLLFLSGTLAWSFVEYTFHRFIFHCDDWIIPHRYFYTLHFLIHGIHHFLPMDPYRLVMPPTLFTFLALPSYGLFHLLVSSLPFKLTIFSGLIVGYVIYDLTHYFLHHGAAQKWQYIRRMKAHHMSHHYVHPSLGFGITNIVWDRLFDTSIPTINHES